MKITIRSCFGPNDSCTEGFEGFRRFKRVVRNVQTVAHEFPNQAGSWIFVSEVGEVQFGETRIVSRPIGTIRDGVYVPFTYPHNEWSIEWSADRPPIGKKYTAIEV